MHELIAKWRHEADTIYRYAEWETLMREMADELERAWHDEQHGAYWRDNCGVCKEERLGHDHQG